MRKDVLGTSRSILKYFINDNSAEKNALVSWINNYSKNTQEKYSSLLYSESDKRPQNIESIEPTYDITPEYVDGSIILRDNFDKIF